MRKNLLWFALVAIVVGSAMPAFAYLTITSGDIYALDPTATDYGAVRFKDFTNTADGGRGGNLYLQDKSGFLGSATGSDGRGRVQGDPLWTVGSTENLFKFEYRPVAGATDLILSGATDRSSPGFSRVINDPLKSVNFISFYIQSNEGSTATADNITVNLTDLNWNSLSPGALNFGYPPCGFAKWYLSDPTLLVNGFILQGNIVLDGTIERGESDKVEIAFGHTNPVPIPAAAYLFGSGLVGLVGLRRRNLS